LVTDSRKGTGRPRTHRNCRRRSCSR
jgi:hypothetical protein